MNIRKPVDYSMMYAAIDTLMVSDMEQTKLFREIGRLIDERPEKGAAVAAAEYINTTCPEKSGFSPRSLRRMRDFYRAYKADPDLMARAMNVSWSLNAIIIESCEEHDVRKWYVMACLKYGWSKQELLAQIKDKAHENAELILDEIIDQDFVEHASADKEVACDLLDVHNHSAVKETSFAKRTLRPYKGAVYDFAPNMPQHFGKRVFRKRSFRELFFRLLRQGYGSFLGVAKSYKGVRIPLRVFEKITDGSCPFGDLCLLAGCSG